MESDEQLELLLAGKTVWNDRRASDDFNPYFSFVNFAETFRMAGKLDQNGRVPLNGYNLNGAHFHGTNLDHVDFIEADLGGAKMVGVRLRDTNFYKADLTNAEFGAGYIGDASFSCATLENTDLAQVNLSGADLGWSRFWRAKLYDDHDRDARSASQIEPIDSVADLIKRCVDIKK